MGLHLGLGISGQRGGGGGNSITIDTAPSISGSGEIGAVHTRTVGSYSGDGSVTVSNGRWQKDGVDISPAETGATYTPDAGDDVASIRWVEDLEDTTSGDTRTAYSNSISISYTAPVEDASPAASGDAVVGENLTGTSGTFTGSDLDESDEWQVSDDGSTGWTGTGDTDTTSPAMAAGKYYRFASTASNSGGSLTSYSSAIGPAVVPVITIAGLTSGDAIVGDHAGITMSADVGTITARAWGSTSGGSQFGTGTSPTDYTAADGGTLYATATIGGADYTVSADVHYTAPVAADGISDQSYDEDVAITALDVGADFTGDDLTFTLDGTSEPLPAGLALGSSSGEITGTPTTIAAAVTIVVRATNSGGYDTTSFDITIVEEDLATVPAAMDAPSVIALSDTELQVTLAAAPSNGGATITSYDIRWQEDGGSWTTVTGITSPHTLTSLSDDTLHNVQSRAVNSVGAADWSASGSATTDETIVLADITFSSQSLVETDSVTLPSTTALTPVASSTGTIILVYAQNSPTFTVTVNGEDALAVSSQTQVNGVASANKDQKTMVFFSEEVTGNVVVSSETAYTSALAVFAISTVGGTVRSWSSEQYVADNPGDGSGAVHVTADDVPYGEGDLAFVSAMGTTVGAINPGFTKLDTVSQNTGGILGKFGALAYDADGGDGTEDIVVQSGNFNPGSSADIIMFSQQRASLIIPAAPPVAGHIYPLNAARTSSTIAVSGYASDTGSIECRVIDDTDAEVEAWETLSANASGGDFSGTMTIDKVNKPLRLQMRYAADTGSVFTQSSAFFIGDYVAHYGQSNALNMVTVRITGETSVAVPAGTKVWDADNGAYMSTIGHGMETLCEKYREEVDTPVMFIAGGFPATTSDYLSGDNPPLQEMETALGLHDALHGFIWIQGEGDVGGFTQANTIANIESIHSDFCTAAGALKANVPMVGVQMATFGGTFSEPAITNWSLIRDMQKNYGSLLTNGSVAGGDDAVRNDEYHYYAESYMRQAERIAYEFGRVHGENATSAIFEVDTVTRLTATTTRVTYSGGLGTDIEIVGLPHDNVADSGEVDETATTATGMELTEDNWTTPIATTGTITGTREITLTHASMSLTGCKFRSQWGLNPGEAGIVRDDGVLKMPAMTVLTQDVVDGA